MIRATPDIAIDDADVAFTFIRSSGPGGQNVNKVATGVQLRFDVAASGALPEPVKRRLTRLAGRRMTDAGVLIIAATRHRTQHANRRDAIDRLVRLIRRAAVRPARRVATAPTRASRQRRLDTKKRRASTKQLRRPPEP